MRNIGYFLTFHITAHVKNVNWTSTSISKHDKQKMKPWELLADNITLGTSFTIIENWIEQIMIMVLQKTHIGSHRKEGECCI
mgnify:CR=1 FL=1